MDVTRHLPMSAQQSQVFAAVQQFPGMKLAALAGHMHWPKSPLSRRLAELIQAGHILRLDRRYWLIGQAPP
jgi:DNA-binding MarR family transcriptional regulator